MSPVEIASNTRKDLEDALGESVVTNNNVLNYEYNDFNYTVILFEENGFGVVNKNVTVEFLGKTYNITTDNQGKATLNLILK